MAAHLGILCRLFQNCLCEDDIFKADETPLLLNMDNGRTLGLAGEAQIRCADVVSGGEAFIMMVLLTRGVHGCIEPPFIVSMNKARNFPIKGVLDDIPGAAY